MGGAGTGFREKLASLSLGAALYEAGESQPGASLRRDVPFEGEAARMREDRSTGLASRSLRESASGEPHPLGTPLATGASHEPQSVAGAAAVGSGIQALGSTVISLLLFSGSVLEGAFE